MGWGRLRGPAGQCALGWVREGATETGTDAWPDFPQGPDPAPAASLSFPWDGPAQSPTLASGLGSSGCWAMLTSCAVGKDTANLRGQGHLLLSQGTAPPTHPLRTWTVSPGKFARGFPLLPQALAQSLLPSLHSARQSGLSGPQAFVGREAAGWGETVLLL